MEEEKSDERVLLDKRYRVVARLATRPRLALSLGRRRAMPSEVGNAAPGASSSGQEPLVAIRELALADFSPIIRAQVESAAIEEFAAPTVFSSSLLPVAGDRIWLERDKLYLVLQLEEAQSSLTYGRIPAPTTLDLLLLDALDWPSWLDERVTFEWSMQLCRMVARLHHQGIILGNLSPRVILVYAHEDANREHARIVYTPLLLPCWPPAPCYWHRDTVDNHTHQMFAAHDYATAFPIGRSEREDAFAAPEMSYESRIEVTERADVYSLGAILYLLLTHYAPTCASLRLDNQQHSPSALFDTPRNDIFTPPPIYSIPTIPMGHTTAFPRFEHRRQAYHRRLKVGSVPSTAALYEQVQQGLDLLDPRSLNPTLSPQLADIVMQALALDPTKRFVSAFAMVEALEAIDQRR